MVRIALLSRWHFSELKLTLIADRHAEGETMDEPKLKHLAWAIQSRARNQMCSLQLLALFNAHEKVWKTRKYARAAQDLTAVAFSLWRAAFLAEKIGTRSAVFEHGRKFLAKIIEDNAIAFTQDKGSNEWTFNYYTRNARSSLQTLYEYWPEVVGPYQGKKLKATDRWDYCQALFEIAVAGFEARMVELKAEEDRISLKRTTRSASKQKRRTVRALTLADTNEAPKVTTAKPKKGPP